MPRCPTLISNLVRATCLSAALAAVTLLVACATAEPTDGIGSTKFVLSDAQVPPGALPFASVNDERPEDERRSRRVGRATYFGEQNLAGTIGDALRADFNGLLSGSNARHVERLRRATLTIKQFEFSHMPTPADKKEPSPPGVPPAVDLFGAGVMAMAGGPHDLALRLTVDLDGKPYQVEEVMLAGKHPPQLSYQMRGTFQTLVARLYKKVVGE